MPEKRDIIRCRKRLLLRFGSEEPVYTAFTEDLSMNGLFIKAARGYPSKYLVQYLLADSNDNMVSIKGMVMWAKAVPPNLIHIIKKGGMGVKITTITEGQDVYRGLCG